MTRSQLARINKQLDVDDDLLLDLEVEEARANLPPAELARIDADADDEDVPDDEDEDDDLDLEDDDLVDDDGIEDEEAIVKPAVVMGLGPDMVFRHTADQLGDPVWCRSTQADRAKAASLLIVP